MKPEMLKSGDTIAIVAPAKAIEEEKVLFAKEKLEACGFRVLLGEHVTGQFHYFSGTDEERAMDFQWAIDQSEVKAVLCARGGYGCIRILDYISWSNLLQNPKWIIGFSDITVFHQYFERWQIPTLHATMPLDFQTATETSFESLVDCLTTTSFCYELPSCEWNRCGKVTGKLIGGNLSILYSLIGTGLQPDYQGKILFIEDVGEALYAIDRMFYALDKSGILDEIVGLVVGGMTHLKDSEPAFGQKVEEIILAHFRYRQLPLIFNFPAGHQNENLALILGAEVEMEVTDEKTILKTI